MPTINANGKRLKPSAAPIDTPYWKRVFEMGRGRYHRRQAHFSATAQENAHDAHTDVAAHYGVSVRECMRDTLFSGWFSKFQHYVEKGNAFAALACFQHMETRARVVSVSGAKSAEWIQ